MKANIRSLKVDLPIDREELFSPLPNGATFRWPPLKTDVIAASSVEAAAPIPKRKFSLVRSPALTEEEWLAVLESRKVLLLSDLEARW